MKQKILITKKEMTALNGSIEKWNGILKGDINDEGTTNCPLCQIYIRCEQCIIKICTGQNGCDGIDYDSWASHQLLTHDSCNPPYTIECDKCEKYARTIRDKLTKIRENTKVVE